MMGTYVVYTDASSDHSVKGGGKNHGIGIAIIHEKVHRVYSEHFKKDTSSNFAEIFAACRAISMIPEGSVVLIRTDSQAAIEHLTRSTNSKKYITVKEVAWEHIARMHEVKFSHIKGHQGVDGDPYQNLVDRITNRARVDGVTFDVCMHQYSEEIEKFGMRKP